MLIGSFFWAEILGARVILGDPYLNSTTVLFDSRSSTCDSVYITIVNSQVDAGDGIVNNYETRCASLLACRLLAPVS